MPRSALWTIPLVALFGAALGAQNLPPRDPAAHIRAAEVAVQKSDFYLAESEYRFAAAQALLELGNLATLAGHWDDALTAYGEAGQNLADPSEPMLSVAKVYLQQQQPGRAETVLRELAAGGRRPEIMHMLALTFAAENRFPEAMQQIEEARHAAPDDPELALGQATIGLQAGKLMVAEQGFNALLRLRPGAATHVLIGRTWRDYEHFEQAERELHLALRLDPTARRANYYLGTILVRRPDGLKDAIVAFQRELEITPDDYLSTLNAGIALTADRRAQEAVPLLRRAWQMNPKEVRPLYHLGQAQFQAGDTAGAVDSLDRYLEAASKDVNTLGMVGSAEYVLAQSLHSLGRDSEAAAHFERAKDLKEKYRAESQDQLQQYLASDKQSSPEGGMGQTLWRIPAEPNVPAQAEQARAALSDIVARAYFNLGVILSQRSHFPAAAASFYRASRWEPGFPRVDAALGTARFQAAQYEPAIEPLKKALAQEPTSTDISRLLALACFQAKSYRCAAQMLEHDPRVESDPAMEYALGVSLVNVGQPAQAAEVFSRLIERNQGSADLYVLLGNAHAQQDDYEEALKQFDRALQLDPKVREANLSAGLVLLRQGKLPEAERRFRAELASDPKSTRASYHLAYVLTLQQKGTEAVPLLRGVLKQNPALADARYLLGQTLLEQGDTAAAVEQLEASVRLAPGEARSHYQLGRAYQKLGRSEEAQQQFALFQKLKQPEKKE